MWYEDENYLWKISENVKLKEWEENKSYNWLVPFCIDKDADNIWDFLGEWDLSKYVFSKNYKELKLKLEGWSKDRLASFLWPYVTKLASFEFFGRRPWKTLWENIQDWLDDDQQIQEREKELEFFFRQYSKVLTYMQDRKVMVEHKIAADIIKSKERGN
jgi:hypothetical protein